MNKGAKIKMIRILAVIAAIFVYPCAYANLGGDSSSVKNLQHDLNATRAETTSYQGYSVQKLTSGSLVINEYISSSGLVFGVAWSGRKHPDLKKLLGPYHGDYKASAESIKKNHMHGVRSVKGSQVTVETWGHMRKLQGHAFLLSQLPTGVSPGDIK